MHLDLPLVLSALTAALAAALFADLARGTRRLRHLRNVSPLPADALPLVSIVIAARNEAHTMEPALRSVLAQQGCDTEVIVVDDRSDDGTGALVDRMAADEPRLRALHVDALPAGWLGKNHALHAGAAVARGELLLFTDADVVLAPDTVARAASYLVAEGLGHVAGAPRVKMPGALLQAFGVAFGVFFLMFTRPWAVRDPRSPRHVGVGAFNLVRADLYRRMGGHRAIAMRPDDDVKLGKLVKRHGGRQDLVVMPDHVSVEWYPTVRAAVRGLRKNAFAGVDYRVSVVLAATVMQLLVFVLPFVGIWVTAGWTRALFGAAVVLLLGIYAGAAHGQRTPAWHGILLPVASLLFVVILWNAMLYALRHRGIEWRGTHYPLDALRANRV